LANIGGVSKVVLGKEGRMSSNLKLNLTNSSLIKSRRPHGRKMSILILIK
jgi:hypothetical protein